MKRLTLSVLGLLLAMPLMAEEVDRTLDAAPDGDVDISNIAGSVTVQGWSRSEVEVTGILGRNVEELIFERDGKNVTIKVKVPKKGGRGIDSDLEVSVPQRSSIDVGTVSADITVSDVLGEQRLHTVSGDVEVEAAASDIDAESVSGDVEVVGDRKETETNASTVSGDVTLFRLSGEIRAESVSGDVIIDEGSFERAQLETVNGDLVFNAELRKGGRFSAETVNGDVEAEFAGDFSAKVDVDTFNGSIRNCFGHKAQRTSKYAPGYELSFSEGSGNSRVEISTMNGSVNICRD